MAATNQSDLNVEDAFVPLLTTRDWNEEWKELQKRRRRADDASFWDERAKTFTTKSASNPYVDRFLELARIEPGETVFDMGCGTGALSVPLGEAGHQVVAADFSQGMLDQLRFQLDARGVRTVFPKLMSWDDDWPSFGVRPGMTDVALASRSIATADLRDSLLRLTDVARRRVCVTLATSASPRADDRVLAALGLKSTLGHDHLYALNILAAEGLKPQLAYIESERADTFDSLDEARATFGRMIDDVAAFAPKPEVAAAHGRLDGWLVDNLVENEHVGQPDKKGVAQGHLRLREPRIITWAFLAWDK